MAHILMIDDEQFVCKLFARMLEQAGYRVVTAHSGEDGLQRFQQERPAVTLLDLHLPGMDGLAVLRQLRVLAPAAKVIILTGISHTEEETAARRLGVMDFLRKDLDIDVILQRIRQMSRESAGSGVAPEGDDRLARLLVADDDPGVARLCQTFLTKQGYRVSTAGNGKDALHLVKQLDPHLLLLDLHMPMMNGVEVLRALAAEQAGLGIILISGETDAHLVQETLALGAFDYLSKPLDLDQLAVSVRTKLILMQAAQRPGWKQWFRGGAKENRLSFRIPPPVPGHWEPEETAAPDEPDNIVPFRRTPKAHQDTQRPPHKQGDT